MSNKVEPDPIIVLLPDIVNDPVIPEFPLLCPVDRNVCEADMKFCPCHEPEMSDAI